MNETDPDPKLAQDEPDLDPDAEDEEIDDAEIRRDVIERTIGRQPGISGHQSSDDHAADVKEWKRVAVTDESVTVALDARVGCLVRVISWDLDGCFHMTTTWCPSVTIADLLHGART